MKNTKILSQLVLLLLFAPRLTRAQLALPPCIVPDAGYQIPYNTVVGDTAKKFLADLIPKPFDKILTVKVHFFVINKTDGTGIWDHNTEPHCDNAILQLNDYYSHIDTPTKPLTPAAQMIADTRIRFVKSGYTVINDTYQYENCDHMFTGYPIGDCDAINVIFCRKHDSTATGAYTYPLLPAKYIFFPGDIDTVGLPDPHPTVDDNFTYFVLPHEMGHALGLTEVFSGAYSVAKSPFDNDQCNKYLVANDLVQETIVETNVRHNCQHPMVYWQFSNNIMSYNDWCRHYLSPLQMALIHFNLRTGMKDVLTTQGRHNALWVDHQFDHTISSGTELWATDRYVKGDVIVGPGAGLTILCNVAMAQDARIIVKPGGQLNITGRVTNISGQLWSGIQVGGADTLDQTFGSNGFANHQGIVRLFSAGNSLSNAQNAIKNYLTDTIGGITWGSSGGIVLSSDTKFLNNNRDVEFFPLHGYQSASSFYRCNFLKNGPINTLDSTEGPINCISLWDIQGVRIRACNFQYSAGNAYLDHGTGIGTYDATYSVDSLSGGLQTVFTGWNSGVYATAGNPLRIPAVNNSSFYDHVVNGAYFQGITGIGFNNNYVRIPAHSGVEGAYLNSCQQYNITNCTFKEDTTQTISATGIRAYNSAAGSHNIYRNKFNHLQMGISAIGNNSGANNTTNGLKMNCNDFSAKPNNYDVALLRRVPGAAKPTVNKQQSTPQALQSFLRPVRNIYGASSSCAGCEVEWYIQDTSARRIEHISNSQSNTQPLPQPSKSDTAVHVTNSNQPLNYSSDCTPGQLSSGNTGTAVTASRQIGNINSYLGTLLSDNKDDQHHFEIEAALARKLYLFLTDSTVQNHDSVIAVLSNNSTRIENADILTIYAYMNKNDLATAKTKIDALPESKTDWKNVLTKLLDYQKHPQHLYDLSPSDISFWTGRAANEANVGFAAGCSILKRFTSAVYADPRPQPITEGGSGSGNRLAQKQAIEPTTDLGKVNEVNLLVYPNPANDRLIVRYPVSDAQILQLQMSDGLGRVIFSAEIRPGDQIQIPMLDTSNGVYQVNARNSSHQVYRTKVICIH